MGKKIKIFCTILVVFAVMINAINILALINEKNQNKVSEAKNYFLTNDGNTIIVFDHVSMVYYDSIWLSGRREYKLLNSDRDNFHTEFKKWLLRKEVDE